MSSGEVDIDIQASVAGEDAVNNLATGINNVKDAAGSTAGPMNSLSSATADAGDSAGISAGGFLSLLYSVNSLMRIADRYQNTQLMLGRATEAVTADTLANNAMLAQYTGNVGLSTIVQQASADTMSRADTILRSYGGSLDQAAHKYQELNSTAQHYVSFQEAQIAVANQVVASDQKVSDAEATRAHDQNVSNQQLLGMGLNAVYALGALKAFGVGIPGVSGMLGGLTNALGLTGAAAVGTGNVFAASSTTFEGFASTLASTEVAGTGFAAALGVVSIAAVGVADVGYKVYSMGTQLNDVVQSGSKDWTQYAGVLLGTTGGVGDLLQQFGLIPASMSSSNQAVTTGLQGMQTVAQSAFAGVASALASIPSTKDITVNSLVSGAISGFQETIATIASIPVSHDTTVGAEVSGAISAIESFLGYLASIPTSITTYINSIWNSATAPSNIPGYQVGTPYVPETQLAVVHKGEAIIPANQNTGGGGSTGSPYRGPTSIQVPISVNVDGQNVMRVLEQRLIRQRVQGSRYA